MLTIPEGEADHDTVGLQSKFAIENVAELLVQIYGAPLIEKVGDDSVTVPAL